MGYSVNDREGDGKELAVPLHPHSHSESSSTYPCGGERRAKLDGRSIEPLRLSGNESVADLIDNALAGSGFNARRLAEGAQLYRHMLEQNATVGITVAGAMTPIGMSGVFNSLIEHGFVDFFIATGANLYHDLHRAFEFPMVQGFAEADDNELADAGIARIYDVFIGEHSTLMATDEVVVKLARKIDLAHPFSTAKLHHALGHGVWETAKHPEKSFVATAAKHDVPIYTSAPGDSSLGMNLIVPQLLGKSVNLNPLLDVIETAAIVRDADQNGVIHLGGGSPKNFYLQTQPTLHQILMDPSKGGHDYFLQLTTDSPHWGGLSGATPGEARSWGKVKDAFKNNVVVYSCASITFPLIAQYVLTRVKPRKQRRLFTRLDEMCDALRSSVRGNTELKSLYPDLFGKG